MAYIILLFIYILQSIALPLELKSPLDDDFYTLPKGYKDAKPGDILKVRPAPNQLASAIFPIDVKNVWQLVVRSEDSFGQPTAFVTTIMEPYNADPSKVVSYQTFEDSSNITCSPSYGIQFRAPIDTLASQIDMTFMVIALKNGYFVNTPDYEGFNSAFTVGRRSGQAVLDSVRALLKSGNITGIHKDAKVGLWGYSGGSLASGWAAALQPTYAPELKKSLVGASLGGFVTNITAVAEIVDGGIFAALIPLALTGLGNEYPQAKKIIEENVAPQYRDKFSISGKQCLVPALFHYFNTNILTGTDPMIPAGFSLLENGDMREIVEGNSIVYLNSTYVPEIPIFVYHGSLDSVVPIKDVYKTYNNWCKWGINSFEFAEDILNGHVGEQLAGGPAGWTWLDRRLQGDQPVKGCLHDERISNLLYPNVTIATKQYFDGIVDSVMEVKLGPEANGMKVRDIISNY
ncbi:secretory lipase 1 [Spathaspora passalidarum NRRL Y-27907]|uniref:Secretory lipase 1 n=1 Tax=Spathaspora passalidarum (strain NRRL Y-27907 / 11-Y1) TaxID=619300 RepID=G3AS41_SPAPN|nr:secretory lipase 1 [Spathaspora passalidarum NRRL Y-27907]EGW31890.1 secretory lipase 1 [Spathaspora passalidarum NRRL Y-27907]